VLAMNAVGAGDRRDGNAGNRTAGAGEVSRT
jgi:hypothetical protein